MNKPIIAITMGDAAGIGPEITCKSLLEKSAYQKINPFVIGDFKVINNILRRQKTNCVINKISDPKEGRFEYGTIDILDYDDIDIHKLRFGTVSAMCGKAAVNYTQEACRMAIRGQIDAIVSAPLNKASMRSAGFNYEGQTEIIGEMTGSQNYGMILLGKSNILMYSTHMSLIEACKKVTYDGVIKKIKLANEGLELLNKKGGKIGISALNPHCGEGGLFGHEEIDHIIPAIEFTRKQGIDVFGPIAADIAFTPSILKNYDIMIAMYHDQANMAMKILGFGSIVTLLVGVPILRTSTGHGTAFDIAGQNIANHNNLLKAIKTAGVLATKRKGNVNESDK